MHWKQFSRLWVFLRWCRRFSGLKNLLLQMWHTCLLSSWQVRCFIKLTFCTKVWSQLSTVQEYFLSPKCVSRWLLRDFTCLLHIKQVNFCPWCRLTTELCFDNSCKNSRYIKSDNLWKGDPEVHFFNAMLFCRYYDLPEKLNLNKLVVLGSPVSKQHKYTV